MIDILTQKNGRLERLEQVEKGCWVNIYPPFDRSQLEDFASQNNVPIDFLTDSLDTDERSRYESEEEIDLVVVNTPVRTDAFVKDEALYITIPIGIISTPDFIITISSFKNPVIDDFLHGRIKMLKVEDQQWFTLRLLDRNVHYFQYYLKEINTKRYTFESEIYRSSRNRDLKNLLDLQKSLVYFVTNLRANDLMMNRMRRTNFLKIQGNEEQDDFLEDIIIDNGQASEMADIYTNIVNSMMDAFASIISNNLGRTVQRLTVITIVLTLPMVIASFYGMNIALPMQEAGQTSLWPFWTLLGISVVLPLFFWLYFRRKRWF